MRRLRTGRSSAVAQFPSIAAQCVIIYLTKHTGFAILQVEALENEPDRRYQTVRDSRSLRKLHGSAALARRRHLPAMRQPEGDAAQNERHDAKAAESRYRRDRIQAGSGPVRLPVPKPRVWPPIQRYDRDDFPRYPP